MSNIALPTDREKPLMISSKRWYRKAQKILPPRLFADFANLYVLLDRLKPLLDFLHPTPTIVNDTIHDI